MAHSESETYSLEATAWVLAELPGQTLLPDAPATLRFDPGRIFGSDGCNRYGTKYSQSGLNLKIAGQAFGTRIACPADRMQQADAFMKALSSSTSFRIEDGNLLLLDGEAAVLARFAPQLQQLAGTTWNVTAYNNGRQAVVSVLRDSELNLSFSPDGKVSGSAGCNQFNGVYRAEKSRISIGALAATRRMCAAPAGLMEQETQFLKALESAVTARFEANRLELRTGKGALAVTLTAK